MRILYYLFASSESRPNFELKSWSKLLNFAMRCSNSTAGTYFLGNLLLVLLRTPVVILVLFPLCEYAGSRAHDNICGDQTWYEASAEKKSHRKIALEQSQLAEIKVGQKLKKCGVPHLERRQHSTGPRSSVSSQALPALRWLWVRRGVFGQCGGFFFSGLFEKRLGAALTWCWLPQAGHPPPLSARSSLVQWQSGDAAASLIFFLPSSWQQCWQCWCTWWTPQVVRKTSWPSTRSGWRPSGQRRGSPSNIHSGDLRPSGRRLLVGLSASFLTIMKMLTNFFRRSSNNYSWIMLAFIQVLLIRQSSSFSR